MPNMNIPIDRSLLTAVSRAAQDEGLLQRDWVVKKLAEAVGWEKGAGNGGSGHSGGRDSGSVGASVNVRFGRKETTRQDLGSPAPNGIKPGVDGEPAKRRSEQVPQEREVRAHDPKTCRLYGCIQCKLAGVKDDGRGL